MSSKRSGMYYATRQAARFAFVGGLLLALAAYLTWAVGHPVPAILLGMLQTVVVAGCMWFHWGERAVALIRRHK
jgi:hypothetical protein